MDFAKPPRWGILGALLLLIAGCQQPESEPPTKEFPEQEKSATQTNDSTVETWDAIFMGGSKIGYNHAIIEQIEEKGQACVRTRGEVVMKLKRFGQPIEMKINLESVDTSQGALVHCQASHPGGSSTARVTGKQLRISVESPGKTISENIAWKPDWGGFFALEQSFLRKPMKAGEKRTVHGLTPLLNQPAEMLAEAKAIEDTQLLEGPRKLLRIDQTTKLPDGQELDIVVWVDHQGNALKSYDKRTGQELYRTTKKQAIASSDDGGFDLGTSTTVTLAQSLRDPHNRNSITYRVKLERSNPAEIFSNSPSQSVVAEGKNTATITVRNIVPSTSLEASQLAKIPQPIAADLKPNNLIQSDDRRIVQMADQVAQGETDAWKLATAIERHVGKSIRTKNFSQAFASAAEVVESLEGDCTEHAVLLAALCRARKIPARVAIGLVYYRGGFAYHMWNEVWIKDRWVPLDATLGLGGIGGGHIKISDSNLAGSGALSTFLPVTQVIGQLKIEIP